MEIDKAFKFALILAWEDLMKAPQPGSARVVYDCKPGTSLDYVSVWSARAWGYYDLVCDYWMQATSAHARGACFKSGYYSDKLAETLDFIMKNQDQFTRPADGCRDGLVLIYAPTEEEGAEAAAWMKAVHGAASYVTVASDEGVAAPLGRRAGKQMPVRQAKQSSTLGVPVGLTN
jgi:hypothetical protein